MTSAPRIVLATALGILLFGALGAHAAGESIPLDAHGKPQWQIRKWNDHPVRIELSDRAELARLLQEVPLAAFDREQVRYEVEGKARRVILELRVTGDEHARLEAADWRPRRLRDLEREGREAAEKAWAARAAAPAAEKVFAFPLSDYPSHAEIGTIIDDIVAAHPTIARAFQWGTSIQGKELWGIVISDDVQNSEPEPEIRLSSTMHGDEPVGTVMLLDFAEYLTTNYGQPGFEDVTALVDDHEIHIMPLHNPDGNAAGSRYNSNSVDLNRNYPDPAGTHTFLQQENANFMAHALAHHFVISANFHGGSLVVNYPWDYTYTLAPDNAAMIRQSLEYSTYNLPMYNSPSFPQGITNGAAWYVATGTLQDWSYDQTDCIDVTIEVSNVKWPPASQLTTFWNENRESLIHYVQGSRYGLSGVVTEAGTGTPLDATVTVTGNPVSVGTDPAHGDYYKLLDTGTYEVTFDAPGHIAQTISGLAVTWGTVDVHDVQLVPSASGDVAGTVQAVGGAPLAALVEVYTNPLNQLVASTTAAGDGTYTVAGLEYGSYRLIYTAPGYAGINLELVLDAPLVTAPLAVLAPPLDVTPFASTFESATPEGWSGTWGLASGGAQGTVYHMTDSPGGDYTDNLTSACAMATGVDLTWLISGTVSFWARWDIETNYDACRFEVSSDGGSFWTPLATGNTVAGSGQGVQASGEPVFESSQTTWVLNEVDLAPWRGLADVRFRFVLASDVSITGDGFHFDEFTIQGQGVDTLSDAGDVPLSPATLTGVYPNPFNPSTRIVFELARATTVNLRVYDLTGRLVRTLAREEFPAGRREVRWNGLTDAGRPAASGVYLVRLEAGGVRRSTKAMLVK